MRRRRARRGCALADAAARIATWAGDAAARRVGAPGQATIEEPALRAGRRVLALCVHAPRGLLHAQTSVPALDRRGLERLCRYGLRSSFALSRLSEREDGRLTYRLERPWPDGRTELVLEPRTLLRRLAHLIPPARSHLVRYHGGFAPASPIRSAIRPRLLREPGRCLSHDPAGRPASRRPEAVKGNVGDELTIDATC